MKRQLCGLSIRLVPLAARRVQWEEGYPQSEELLMPRSTKKKLKNVVAMPMPAATILSTDPSRDDVARRAFELYCERGYQHGYDIQDWLQAERELRRTASTAA